MPDLLATVRAALIAEGASPATAELLAVDLVERSRVRIERDRAFNDAQRLLPLLGAVKAAERLGVCKATIYYRAARKSKERQHG